MFGEILDVDRVAAVEAFAVCEDSAGEPVFRWDSVATRIGSLRRPGREAALQGVAKVTREIAAIDACAPRLGCGRCPVRGDLNGEPND